MKFLFLRIVHPQVSSLPQLSQTVSPTSSSLSSFLQYICFFAGLPGRAETKGMFNVQNLEGDHVGSRKNAAGLSNAGTVGACSGRLLSTG